MKDLTLYAYTAEYSSDGQNTWDCGGLYWSIDAATEEARTRGQQAAWRIRRIRIADAGLVDFDSIVTGLDNLCEMELLSK